MSLSKPFAILGIDVNADDQTIHQAYLNKVRESPPDRDPRGFQAIHSAYQAIRDKRARLMHELFHMPEADLNSIVQVVQANNEPGRPSQLLFQEVLQACLLSEPENSIEDQ